MKYILIIILVVAVAFLLWKMKQFDKTIPTLNPEDGTLPNGSDSSQQNLGQTANHSKSQVQIFCRTLLWQSALGCRGLSLYTGLRRMWNW